MRAGSLNTITQYLCIMVFAVILPVNCIVHCALHATMDKPRSRYVCILDAHVSPTHTQLLPHAYQPSATHEAVCVLLVHIVVDQAHTRVAPSIQLRKQLHSVRPDYPPPRGHALSLYSL
jgi:hypothetical protein